MLHDTLKHNSRHRTQLSAILLNPELDDAGKIAAINACLHGLGTGITGSTFTHISMSVREVQQILEKTLQ